MVHFSRLVCLLLLVGCCGLGYGLLTRLPTSLFGSETFKKSAYFDSNSDSDTTDGAWLVILGLLAL